VADGLSTAFMVLPAEEIAGLCGRSPGLSAWLIPETAEEGENAPTLVHLAAPGSGGG
jgi:thiamine biosynthesis lipoprotein ApbE